MLQDHAPELMRLIARGGTENLKKKFCWETLNPPACPPIEEQPVKWEKQVVYRKDEL